MKEVKTFVDLCVTLLENDVKSMIYFYCGQGTCAKLYENNQYNKPIFDRINIIK